MIKKTIFPKNLFFIIFIIIIIIFGGVITLIIAQNTREDINTNLLNISETVTATINPNGVKSITFSDLDYSNPDVLRLNEQLEKVQKFLAPQGIKWSYLVSKKNNLFLFSVDSVPIGQPDDTIPGEVYNDPPLELQKIFEDQKSVISQPYTDEWGNFVSAFIPIKDFSTGELLAVAGFDVNYQYIQSEINYHITFPIVLTIFILIFYIVTHILISRQSNQNQALKESEERFHLITEFAIDPIIMMNEEGNIVLLNKAAEKTFGYSEKEALGKSLYRLVLPPEKYDDIFNLINLKKFTQTGQSQFANKVSEMEIINKAGKTIQIEFSITLIKIENKNYVLSIIRDISTRKENENLLIQKTKEVEESQLATLNILEDIKEEKSKTDALLLGIGDGVIAINEDAYITYANQTAEKILGWRIEDMVGKLINEVIPVEDHTGKNISSSKEVLSPILKKGESLFSSLSNPIFYISKNKIKIPVSASFSPIKMGEKIIGAINIFRDITHEIEVDKMKNEFISLASHQLRTPLSAIKWYAEMLLAGDAGKLNSEQNSFIDNIHLSNQRMIDLVNTLLNISRIESGRIIIESQPIDLKEIISGVVSEFAPKLKEKEQTIIVNINPALKKINGDPKLIFEVYKNLISNAIKYSRQKGEIQVFVSSDKDNIINQVTDEGFGIPKKDESKVFSKFYRGENISRIETEGTGLGLYLVKAIVESSGGKIWFKSEENKGTTFWFSLPLKGVKPKKGEVSINS